jgi:lipoate-protein ligase B
MNDEPLSGAADGEQVAAGSLEVYLLGVVDFDSALTLQSQLAAEVAGRRDTQGAVLMCEHPPLVTIGRDGSRGHVVLDDRELAAREMPVLRVARGGGTFVHAPGQLAAHVVVPLDRLRITPADYRRRLEEAVIGVCDELFVSAERQENSPGVFCRFGQVAHVGVAVRGGTTGHGLFLNVNLDPGWLKLLRPDEHGVRPTTLATQRTRVTEMSHVRESLVRHLAAQLGYDRFHVYTGHPHLRRMTRTVYQYA